MMDTEGQRIFAALDETPASEAVARTALALAERDKGACCSAMSQTPFPARRRWATSRRSAARRKSASSATWRTC